MEIEGGNVIDVDKVLHDLPPESEYARLALLMELRAERMVNEKSGLPLTGSDWTKNIPQE